MLYNHNHLVIVTKMKPLALVLFICGICLFITPFWFAPYSSLRIISQYYYVFYLMSLIALLLGYLLQVRSK